MTAIDIRGVSKTFGTHRAVDDVLTRSTRGVHLRLHRAKRLRQDDDDQDDHEHHPARSGRHRRCSASAARHAARDDVELPPGRARPVQADAGAPAAAVLRPAQGPVARASSTRLIAHWLERLRPRRVGATSGSISSRRAWRRRSSSSPPSSRSPKLLILDEPFSGLDPVNAEALRDAVLELRRRRHDRSCSRRTTWAPPKSSAIASS